MNESTSPELNLQEPQGPALVLDAAPPQARLSDSGTALAVGMLATIALLAALLLVPLSREADSEAMADASPTLSWLDALRRLLPGQDDDDDTDEASAPASSPAPGADPFAAPLLSALKGQYCKSYLPGTDATAARQVFADLLWDKLDESVQTLMLERLDVCTPFEAVSGDVISAGGCRKSQCGRNDASFYINTQGKVAVDYRVDGVCNQATEDGFTQTGLLCQ